MNRKANRKSPIAMIVSISIVILIAILGSIYYKFEVAQSATEEKSVEPTELENEETQNKTNETEEPVKPQDENVDDLASSEQNGENPSTNSGEQPIKQPAQETPPATEEVALENGYIVGQKPATEPTFVKGVLIANKKNPLPSTYNKGEDPKARAAFEKMAKAAMENGIELVAFSGFRSYEYQQTLYDRYVKRDGKEAADRYSARPGYSEHQTGLAFDIGEKSREDLWLTNEFGDTEAGQWLAQNAHKYGFILRYPKGKEEITGFMHESWHFRYLEGELATRVFEAGVTLEEYLGIQ
ncbi:M15 family metallopeptidase [Solibacillus isronensis]|uniref:M15 family metallopeptidase n=1 Tax=Solibacillus isronensis TaxID=412383 RepID=UPI00203C392E|nr:M15 family metallopeptidase [Solibacillus isronensis]MCM3723791.1 M15 family metallopeptidase [Solibacillus isronensis]